MSSTEIVCGGEKTSESEFQLLPSGTELTAACGPNGLSAAARWADQSLTTPSTVAVYQQMRTLGKGGVNGASTVPDLVATAQVLNYKIVPRNPGENVPAFLTRMAGKSACVLEVARGQNLRDKLTGYGEDATGLLYHYITVWGWYSGGTDSAYAPGVSLPAGYWCSDGDNDSQNLRNGTRYHWPLNQRMVYYPADVLATALPYDAFAVLPRVAIPGNGGNGMQIPTGWKDDGTTLTAPNGVVVVGGMRAFVLNYAGGWDANEQPLAHEQNVVSVDAANAATGSGVSQLFRHKHLVLPDAPANHHVQETWAGAEICALSGQLSDTAAHAENLAGQLAAAQAQIAALKAANPLAQRALDTLTALKAFLGEL